MAAVEPIMKGLNIAGVDIFFENFNIKCFPGFNISVLYKNEVSVYEVEKQNFTFQVSTEDYSRYNIKQDIEFYLSDSFYKHKFKLDRAGEHDLTGFTKLHANHIGREKW
jgi:hypothetical protein